MEFYRKIFLLMGLLLLLNRCGYTATNTIIEQKITQYHLDRNQIKIYIDKSAHTLSLQIGIVVLKNYHCVFGKNPIDDKMQEGDRCTPEGVFHIRAKYPHKDWSKFIWIDYPTAASQRKFDENKRAHKIPIAATIGGDIGIHGVPDFFEPIIDAGVNWTHGCISLKNADVNEIYNYVQVGTEVVIVK